MFRLFKKDEGATDPILVIAAIAVSLILLIGGSFAVTSLINNAKNLNAQKDVSEVVTAEQALVAGTDSNGNAQTYETYSVTADGTATGNLPKDAAISFTPTPGDQIQVITGTASGTVDSYLAIVKSPTGKYYYASSVNSTPTEADTLADITNLPSDITATTVTGLSFT